MEHQINQSIDDVIHITGILLIVSLWGCHGIKGTGRCSLLSVPLKSVITFLYKHTRPARLTHKVQFPVCLTGGSSVGRLAQAWIHNVEITYD